MFGEFCEKDLDFVIAKGIDAEQRALTNCGQEFLGNCLIPLSVLIKTYQESGPTTGRKDA